MVHVTEEFSQPIKETSNASVYLHLKITKFGNTWFSLDGYTMLLWLKGEQIPQVSFQNLVQSLKPEELRLL